MIELEYNSQLYWIVTAAYFFGLLFVGYLYVTICWKKWEPAAKDWVSRRYGVKIIYEIVLLGFFYYWQVDKKSKAEYTGNLALLEAKIALWNTVVFFNLLMLWMAFLVGVWISIYLLFEFS